MAGYSARISSMADGDVITAALFNNEFTGIINSFNATSGHTHDGTAGEGGIITALRSNPLTFGAVDTTDVVIKFEGGSGNDGTLTWDQSADYFQFSDDILLTTTEKLQFRDTAIYINSSTDGQLDIVADTEIQIAATTVDINGNVDISGTLTVGGAIDFGDQALANVGNINLDKITGDADADTSITFSGSDVITIEAGGSTRAVVNTSGINVTGTVIADGLTVDAGTSNTIGTIESSTGNAQLNVKSTANTAGDDLGIIEVSGTDGAYIDIAKPNGTGYDLRIQHLDENNSVVIADTSNLVMQVQDTNRAVILKHGANSPKLTTTTTGIDVTGTVTATGIALNGNMETNGDITIQNGHELRFEQADNSESFSIKTSTNTTTLHEQGSGNLNIKGEAVVLFGNNNDLAKITIHDESGVKINSQVADNSTASFTRIKVGNQHTGTRFFCGTDESTVRAEVVSAGLNVTGEIKGDSLDIDGAVDIDTGNATFDLNLGNSTATITTSGNDSCLTLQSTDTTGTNDAPELRLFRSATPSAGDQTGSIRFQSKTTGGSTKTYGRILSEVKDPSNTDYKGTIYFEVQDAKTVNGTLTDNLKNVMELEPDIVKIGFGETTTNLSVNGSVTAGGLNTSDHVVIDNNKRIKLLNTGGTTATEIYTDGSNNTFITEGHSSGSLTIKGESFFIKNADNQALVTSGGGSVQLAHCPDASTSNKRLETTTNGVTISGTGGLIAEQAQINGNAIFSSADTSDQVIIQNTATSTDSAPDLKFKRSGAVGQVSNIGVIAFNALNSSSADFGYANIVADTTNITAGSETGTIRLQVHDPADSNDHPVPRLSVDKNGISVTGKITATASAIGNNDVAVYGAGVADDDFLRINGTDVEGRSAAEVLSDIGAVAASGVASLAAVVVHNQSTDANNIPHDTVKTYVGKTVVYTNTGDSSSLTLDLPEVSGDIAIGQQIHLVNASSGSGASAKIIINMNGAGVTDQDINICTGASVVNVGDDDPHLVAGGVATIVAVAENTYVMFGSGVVDN